MPAEARDISGPIDVVDGDTIRVGGTTVRLHGIDAPEIDQSCEDRAGQHWNCGAEVKAQVASLFQGAHTRCEEIERDRYGRSVAKCFVAGRDIGEQIVENGWAEAYRLYSLDYDIAEKSAQLREVGIWAGRHQSPAEFRADQRAATTQAQLPQTAPQGCVIKGNISESGRIYHMPHNRDYGRTRINTARGEHWFCSEAEALAAGWRAAAN